MPKQSGSIPVTHQPVYPISCSWGQLVPQQYRLVALAASIAPILMGLNSACSYFGMSLGGVIGALGIRTVGAHYLGLIGAALAVLALIFAELANLRTSASSFVPQEIPNVDFSPAATTTEPSTRRQKIPSQRML